MAGRGLRPWVQGLGPTRSRIRGPAEASEKVVLMRIGISFEETTNLLISQPVILKLTFKGSHSYSKDDQLTRGCLWTWAQGKHACPLLAATNPA